jgi:FKBP-type peptidyl-prolyl cis-trans isomerase FkpA
MSVSQVPLRPLQRGAVAKLGLGILLLIAAGVLLAWAGAGQSAGVRVKTIAAGSGPIITASDGVLIEYEGKLDDGTVFDTSEGRGPAFFPVGGVVPGFSQALQKMQKGGRYQFTLPSELGYGETPPAGSPIPPNADLHFTVRVLEVAPMDQIMRGAQGAGGAGAGGGQPEL